MKKNFWFMAWCLGAGVLCLTVILTLANQYSYAAEERIIYDSKNKRDPFIPLVGKGMRLLVPQEAKSIENIILEGIVFDPEQGSLVIINGEIFKEGDSIGGFILSKVTRKSVILTKDEKDYTIILIEEE